MMTSTIKKLEPTTKLERHVAAWLKERAADYNESGMVGVYNDLMQGGCQSGIVGHLIYYSDTLKFYKRHKAEIHALLKECMDGIGCDGPKGLFGDKWDDHDPLADEHLNQNLLAWFGFEESARNLMNRAGYND